MGGIKILVVFALAAFNLAVIRLHSFNLKRKSFSSIYLRKIFYLYVLFSSKASKYQNLKHSYIAVFWQNFLLSAISVLLS